MTYFLRKLFMSALTLWLVATICFTLTKMAGEEAIFGEKNPPPEIRAQIEKKYYLDRPVMEQYYLHLSKLLVLDSLESRSQRNKTLRDMLGDHLPASLRLGARALMLAIVFGVPIGTICAVYHNRIADNTGTLLALTGVSVPNFIIASLLIFLLCREWEFFGASIGPMSALNWGRPTTPEMLYRTPGWLHGIWDEVFRLRLWIPAVALGAFPFAAILRLTRSSMLDALNQDYVRTARAKGVAGWKVVSHHALRNALTPVVTYLGPITAALLTGSLVVEKVFAIPGLGKFFVDSVNNRDLPIIMGLTVFYSALLISMNLLVDAIYPILNPRLKK